MFLTSAVVALVFQQRGTIQKPDLTKQNPNLKIFVDAEKDSSSPKVRSTSFILQDNPEGIAELMRATRKGELSGDCLKLIFSSSEMSRVSASAVRGKVRTRDANHLHLVLGDLGFKPDPVVTADPLDFGTCLQGNEVGSQSVGFYCASSGKVTYKIEGSPAFSVSVVKTSEYVPGNGGSGYEKTVEYSGGSFPANSGMHYDVFVKFNPAKVSGPQTGTLVITEPNRKIEVPLKGAPMAKALSVKVESVQLSDKDISPLESIDVTVNMTVKENSGSQLVFKIQSPIKGVKMATENQWVAKTGPVTQKLRLKTSTALPESSGYQVPIGIYPVGSTSPLATFTVEFGVKREWVEWNYDLTVEKQKIWGKLQLANTGEFIWTGEAYNSSLIFEDKFFTAFCFPGLYQGGKSPGCHMFAKLPAKNLDRFHWQFTGHINILDFQAMKTMSMKNFLSIEEGGPIAAIGDIGQGVVDLFQKEFANNAYETIPDNFNGTTKKWMIKNNYFPIKPKTGTMWK